MSSLSVGRRALAASGAAVALILAVGLGLPAMIDTEAWRPRLESAASARLHRKVSVAGPIGLRLLPAPALSLSAVAVEGMGSLERVRLSLPLSALFSGRPEVAEAMVEGGRLGLLDDLSLKIALSGPGAGAKGTARLWGRPLSLEAKSGPQGTDGAAPLRLSLALPGDDGSLVFEGSASPSRLSGRIEGAAASLGRLGGPAGLPDSSLSLQANLTLTPDEANLADIGILLGESTITGSIIAGLSGSAPLTDVTLRADTLDLGDGRVKPAAAPSPAVATASGGTVVPSASATPERAAESHPFELPVGPVINLDLGIGAVKWRGGTVSNIAVNALLDGGRLTISQASARLPGAGWIKASGTLSTPEGKPAFTGDLKAESRNLPELRTWLGLGSSPAPAHARLEGRLALTDGRPTLNALTLDLDNRRITGMVSAGLDSPIPIHAELGMAGLALGFQGNFGDGRLEGEANLRAAGFAQAVRAFAPAYRPRGNGPAALTARLAAAGDLVTLDPLRLNAGDARVEGKAALSLSGGRPMLTAALTAGPLALDPFLPAEGKAEAAPAPRRRTGLLDAPRPPIVPAALSDGGGWSRTPLDLGWMRTLDADLTLEAKALSLEGKRLEAPRAHLRLKDGAADLEKLTGLLVGGKLQAAGRLSPNAATAALTLRDADLGALGLSGGGVALTRGRADLEAKLAAVGTSPAALVGSLSGDGRFAARDGEVKGFDLAAVDAQLRKLDNLGGVLALVQTGLAGGSSRFSSLSGTFKADRGVVDSRDLSLIAEGGSAAGTARFDLPRETMDAKVNFTFAAPDSPPVGFRISGPWSAPVKAVDLNALQRRLADKLLGGKGQGGAAGTDDAPRKFKAGDALRGLLGAFGKKKE